MIITIMNQPRLTALIVGLLLLASLPLSAQELGDWERVPNVPGHEFDAFWAGDSTLLGLHGGRLVISHDRGALWNRAATDESVAQLHIGDDGVVLALTTDGWFIRSVDYGETFARVDSAWGRSWKGADYRLAGSGNDLYYAVRRSFTTVLFGSSDGGLTWREAPYPDVPFNDLIATMMITEQGTLLVADLIDDVVFAYDTAALDWNVAATLPDSTVAVRLGRDHRLYALTRSGLLYRGEGEPISFSPFPLQRAIDVYHDFEVMGNGGLIARGLPEDTVTFVRFSPTGEEIGSLVVDGMYGSRFSHQIDLEGDDEIWVWGLAGLFAVVITSEESGITPLSWTDHSNVSALMATPADELLLLTARHIYLGRDGAPFSQITTPFNVENNIHSVAFADSTTLLIPGSPSSVYRSTDKGRTWSRVTPPYSVSSVVRDGKGNLYAYPSNRLLLRSVDSGKSWKKVEEVESPASVITFENHVVVLNERTHYRSTDHGETWDTVVVPVKADLQIGTVTTAGTIVGADAILFDTTQSDTEYYVIPGDDDTLLIRSLPCPLMRFYPSDYFVTDPGGRPYYMARCGIYRSDDGGMTWIKLGDYPAGVTPTALLIMEDGTFYLGTTDGLFKTTRVSATPARNARIERAGATIRLLTGSVNASTILLDLPTATRVTIALYDLEGRRVGIIHDGEMTGGEHALPWTPNDELAAGAYLLLMTTAEGEGAGLRVVR